MQIIDEGLLTKLLPDEGMILTDKATETMRTEEIDLAIGDSADNYKDIPIPTDDIKQKAETSNYLIENNNINTQELNNKIMNIYNNIENWVNPKENQKTYNKGDKCYHKDEYWVSTVDNNISEPGSLANTWINI